MVLPEEVVMKWPIALNPGLGMDLGKKKGVILILCVTLTLWGCWEDDDEGRDGASLPDVLCDLDCLPDQDEGGFSVDSFQLDDLSPHVEDVGQGGLDGPIGIDSYSAPSGLVESVT